ncbi:MAG TPA: hypothetical protein VJQ52_16405 [Steroidobacteraceae bacterium]|nr:hypothetical protein [Steroidobacteraceae bacterium]
MNAHRKSFWKTSTLALLFALLMFGAAVVAGRWEALGAAPWFQATAVVILTGVGVAAALAAMGGFVVLHRDTLQSSGRTDLFVRLNRDRSESALLQGGRRGLRLPFSRGAKWMPQVGEMVQVKSFAEIAATLDAKGQLDGLPFMAEMARFCGKRVHVFRCVDKMYDYGRTKTLRRLDHAVELNLFRCDGAAHGGCQAACYIVWKTDWLRPVADAAPSPLVDDDGSAVAAAAAALPATVQRNPDGSLVYSCQYTDLAAAAKPMSKLDVRHELQPLLCGNVTLAAFCVAGLTRLFNRLQRARRGVTFPYMPPGTQTQTPLVNLNLQVGEIVRVHSAERISLTLNDKGRNRGLWFDGELLKSTNQRFKVTARVDRLIDDATGRMLDMKTPCIVLDNLYSTGEYLRFCSQHDLAYWREAWLTRDAVSGSESQPDEQPQAVHR